MRVRNGACVAIGAAFAAAGPLAAAGVVGASIRLGREAEVGPLRLVALCLPLLSPVALRAGLAWTRDAWSRLRSASLAPPAACGLAYLCSTEGTPGGVLSGLLVFSAMLFFFGTWAADLLGPKLPVDRRIAEGP